MLLFLSNLKTIFAIFCYFYFLCSKATWLPLFCIFNLVRKVGPLHGWHLSNGQPSSSNGLGAHFHLPDMEPFFLWHPCRKWHKKNMSDVMCNVPSVRSTFLKHRPCTTCMLGQSIRCFFRGFSNLPPKKRPKLRKWAHFQESIFRHWASQALEGAHATEKTHPKRMTVQD